jgi:hypothetical protein
MMASLLLFYYIRFAPIYLGCQYTLLVFVMMTPFDEEAIIILPAPILRTVAVIVRLLIILSIFRYLKYLIR